MLAKVKFPNLHPTAWIILAALSLSSQAYALEPLVSSSDSLSEKRSKRLIEQYDKNADGSIQSTEDEVFWKRNKKFDTNKDNALEINELKKSFVQAIDSPGEKLLNVLYKNTPTEAVYLDIYYPDENTSKSKPVVFFTHGGGWAAGNKSKASQGLFAQVHKTLLKDGFVVVSVGYRLVNKTRETAMRDCVIDGKDAMRFISAHQDQLGVDSKQFYTFGDSAGGQLSMMLLLTAPKILTGDPDLAKYSYKTVAGVSWYGPCDFRDVSLFNHDDRENFKDRFGGRIMAKDSAPEDKPARYKEMSPVSYLTEKSPPLLMIQGDKDTTIPVKQAYRMQEALKTINAPVEIIIVKNAGHNWRAVDAPIEPTKEQIVDLTTSYIINHKEQNCSK